jgi:glycosyltransferase involved in cell wall biosynthesis
VLPTYNRSHIIGGTIRSVQAQTMPDWELIVVDDGSTDDTRAVVEKFGRVDRRVKLVSNAGRIGPAGTRNSGIRASQAEVIAFLDSDDSWDTGKLEAFLRACQRNPDAVLIGSDYKMTDQTNRPTSTMKSFLFDTMLPWWETYAPAAAVIPVDRIRGDIQVISEQQILLSMAIAGFLWIHTSSVVVRRDAALTAGLFDERLKRTEDIDLWLKLNRLGPIVYLDEVLATYDISGRIHGSGIRYRSYHRSRRHSAYIEAAHHLHSLGRIAKNNPLNTDQLRLLKDRRIAQHRRCAVAALQERRWKGLAHVLACLASKSERELLLTRPGTFFSFP